ncbi:GntR family transcriptional regulator [Erwinia sp. OLTSP20]|uniref:LacI family DNA-binding transcriptional regulator n=1 Tax=unclassified Erwinia TaxID=2622719 RepID=UPI000C176F8B|nr:MULTISPECIES: LacI family DNA-binding transcriptional regulator [unclassified Erwinia]PIJ50320.1 GntR family transcriptional regulator [Erwinia sp. OAMSP11]PIJ72157.1 GntR family transcriptional regulator [Erwinia sp. OLSSP12]PIJ81448.1 GntR family transcriptional regulator [Erwinia sp. OLCASP19]PIJ84154.1 GntR family transcriptional regulator [Erwinia sp. OLMTSP26]PIJ85853.1 GntR family transcriptional regulator [Erwinia sp. OLMDSP33]
MTRGKQRGEYAVAPTLEDVAREAGLSSMTVSRALNNPAIVRPATVARVMLAVEKTGYIPNLLAGSLASRRSRLIAVVVPQINNNMFVDTIQAISDTLAQRGYHMLLCVGGYASDSEAALVATLLSRKPDGIVLTGIHHAAALKKRLINAALPVVEIWDLTPTPIDMLVGFSHEKAGNLSARFLLDKGHRRFGLLWTGDQRALLRKQGAIAVLQTCRECQFVEAEAGLPATLRLGREGMQRLLAQTPVPDAVICSSDTLAQGAILEASAQGIDVPRQLAVMGFGDLDFAAWHSPSITTVAIDRWRLGEEAATMLADKIEGIMPTEPVRDLGFWLCERQSA